MALGMCVHTAEQHLQRRRKTQKAWITGETIELIEVKKRAFPRWQEHRSDVEKRKEYVVFCKRVRRVL